MTSLQIDLIWFYEMVDWSLLVQWTCLFRLYPLNRVLVVFVWSLWFVFFFGFFFLPTNISEPLWNVSKTIRWIPNKNDNFFEFYNLENESQPYCEWTMNPNDGDGFLSLSSNFNFTVTFFPQFHDFRLFCTLSHLREQSVLTISSAFQMKWWWTTQIMCYGWPSNGE